MRGRAENRTSLEPLRLENRASLERLERLERERLESAGVAQLEGGAGLSEAGLQRAATLLREGLPATAREAVCVSLLSQRPSDRVPLVHSREMRSIAKEVGCSIARSATSACGMLRRRHQWQRTCCHLRTASGWPGSSALN